MTVVKAFLVIVRGCVELVCEMRIVFDSGCCVIRSSTSPGFDPSLTNDLPGPDGVLVTKEIKKEQTHIIIYRSANH